MRKQADKFFSQRENMETQRNLNQTFFLDFGKSVIWKLLWTHEIQWRFKQDSYNAC